MPGRSEGAEYHSRQGGRGGGLCALPIGCPDVPQMPRWLDYRALTHRLEDAEEDVGVEGPLVGFVHHDDTESQLSVRRASMRRLKPGVNGAVQEAIKTMTDLPPTMQMFLHSLPRPRPSPVRVQVPAGQGLPQHHAVCHVLDHSLLRGAG